ncbi:hypothetical protein [Acinetobacter sp. B51(2017)]|uniref:hypothetical protein n=1 Tax=Acinetobacter sp. B51(2017) TaxID=2060938 RepID=UPI000F092FE0|nr:hypothetical protein [Acinetobacter sp. B51(2017)]
MPTQADLIFNQELAAWVQAVGSVIAIFVAVCVPLYLNHLQQQRDLAVEQLQKQKYFVTLLPTLYRIQRYSQDFIQQILAHPEQDQHILHHLESEYLELVPVFAKELHIFVHSQIYDDLLNQLAFQLFHAEEILAQYLHNPKQQLKQQQRLVVHSQEILKLSEQLIQNIEQYYIKTKV